MTNFVKNLAALIKVKTIVTFVVLTVYVVLALRGDITPENVQSLTLMVITFYFGTQLDKGKTEQITDHSLCPLMAESTESIESTETDGE